MPAQPPKPITPPMAQLLALRSLAGHGTWQSLCRAYALDDTTLYAWLRGKTVRDAFVTKFALALRVQKPTLCRLRDEIVDAEKAVTSP